MLFKLEEVTLELMDECIPLFIQHYKEISAFQDIELAPNYDEYMKLAELGYLRVFTARNDYMELMGYAVFFVRNNLHYKHSKQAVQDILFLKKEMRGQRIGAEFIAWCDEMLRAEKCQLVYHHVKAAHDWGKLLIGMGYKMVEFIYARRLD